MTREFHLTVSEPVMNTIGDALMSLPYRTAAPVIELLNQQIRAQVAVPQTDEKPDQFEGVVVK